MNTARRRLRLEAPVEWGLARGAVFRALGFFGESRRPLLDGDTASDFGDSCVSGTVLGEESDCLLASFLRADLTDRVLEGTFDLGGEADDAEEALSESASVDLLLFFSMFGCG